jgi:hypothetical protein
MPGNNWENIMKSTAACDRESAVKWGFLINEL